jgi:hypothetical protein
MYKTWGYTSYVDMFRSTWTLARGQASSRKRCIIVVKMDVVMLYFSWKI